MTLRLFFILLLCCAALHMQSTNGASPSSSSTGPGLDAAHNWLNFDQCKGIAINTDAVGLRNQESQQDWVLDIDPLAGALGFNSWTLGFSPFLASSRTVLRAMSEPCRQQASTAREQATR